MAIVGQQLLQPESGWKRFDDNDININYSSNILYVTGPYYGRAVHYSSSNTQIKFNFIGSKLRIIGLLYSCYYSQNIKIKIDGIVQGTFSQYLNGTAYQMLVYEKIGLPYTEHYIEIYTDDNAGLNLDAIDIDSTGQLKPYNVINHKYLIKDGDRIKTTNDGINLIDLGITYDKITFDTYGMNDLSLLNSTVLNKIINNQYKILMYKV